jgi:hypothetical protein
MEQRRLIPYSVHLPEHVHKKLKEAAGDRKASALVRDAITLIIEGDDEFNGGYNKAIRDVIAAVHDDQWCKAIGIEGVPMSEHIELMLRPMIVNQNTKAKNGKKAR